MKKRSTVILVLAVLTAIVAAGAYLAVRFMRHGTDIIGVTSLPEKNVVIMNSASGDEFVKGAGTITVGEGEHAVLTWKLKSGSFDLGFLAGRDAIIEALGDQAAVPGGEFPAETEGEQPPEYIQEKTGIEGFGTETFDVGSGDCTVYFTMHGAVGTATVSVEKD